jgi:aspartokinase/homoserine dehydrogenase 1
MKVMKFGGTSVADKRRIEAVARIIQEAARREKVAVVLSAMKGITDSLIRCARLAETANPLYKEQLASIRDRHLAVIGKLFSPGKKRETITSSREDFTGETVRMVEELLSELKDILHGVELLRECSLHSMDLIMSFGERLSCTLTAKYLQSLGTEAAMVDAREIVVVNRDHGQIVVSPVTYKKIRAKLSKTRGISIITGFVASTEEGVTTTLGRNGSDYTASLVAAAMDAAIIEIWTDVEGVMSADPRCVEGVFVIPEISYQEAMEMSYFGAEVLHPYTMIPAVDKGIPIRIRNTFNPETEGTLIARDVKPKKTPITGIASIENVALVNVEGGGMMGIPGFAARIFGCLANIQVNIIMISQASSEHSICLVFPEPDVDRVKKGLAHELEAELRTRRIQDFEIMKDLAIVAVIGENMRGKPGISGRLFSALGREHINVLAIAQGSSERNISFVIAKKDKEGALRCIHRAFLETNLERAR